MEPIVVWWLPLPELQVYNHNMHSLSTITYVVEQENRKSAPPTQPAYLEAYK